MSTRTRTANAFETQLNGSITDSATSLVVNAGAGLQHPAYLVLDPDVPAKREFIRVGNISGNNFSTITRGLTGSTSGAQAHDSGAVVRAVFTSQALNDLFTDIEAVEAGASGHYGGVDTADHPEATGGARGFMSSADKTKLDTLISSGTVTGGNSHDHNGGDGAQISHANLSNLTVGDPHTQYALETAVWSFVYPVGSIYISTVSTNPNTLFGGGTWAAFGGGRTLVSLTGGDVDFDTAEETGGAKTHIHTMGTHIHTMPTHTHTGPSHTHAISGTTSSNGSHTHSTPSTTGAAEVVNQGQGFTIGNTEHIHDIANGNETLSGGAHTHTFSDTSSAGGTGATGATDPGDTNATDPGDTASTSNMPPYIVVYMWKRTA